MPDHQTYLKLGEIYREHGVKGQCKFYAYDADEKNLLEGQHYILQNENGREEEVEILSIQAYQRYFLIHFDIFMTPEEIVSWRKARLWIKKSDLVRENDWMYDYEWEGFVVIDKHRKKIGKIQSVEHNPLMQFVVTLEKKFKINENILIPFVKDWIIDLDKDKKEIVIDMPEGII